VDIDKTQKIKKIKFNSSWVEKKYDFYFYFFATISSCILIILLRVNLDKSPKTESPSINLKQLDP
jgi:hypothetical protein